MNIKPESTNLEKILTGSSTKYAVPEYQRDYSWTPAELEELWSDINRSWKNSYDYFMGTIVLNTEAYIDEDDHFEIVDGQQRLGTFTILFSVIRAFANKYLNDDVFLKGILRNSENAALANRIQSLAEDRILHRSYPDQYFVALNKKDKVIFENEVQKCTELLEKDCLKINKSDPRVRKTKKYFTQVLYELIEENHATALQNLESLLGHIVKKLEFITIKVESGYDAYLLFESLNSKGMDLSIADLLKNKMLMVCNGNKEQDKVLENWEKMVSVLEDKSTYPSIPDFLRFYWISINNIVVTKNELYKVIKNSLDNGDREVAELSVDLLEKANLFVMLTDKNLEWPSTQYKVGSKEQYLAELNTLKYTICLPVLLFVSANNPELLKEIAHKSINYLFRLVTVGDFSVGKANALFSRILKKLHEGESDEVILASFSEAEKVGDEEFEALFKEFRTKDNKIGRYILTKIHLHENGSELVPNNSEIHLEHVLPQDYSKWESGFEKGVSKWEDIIYHIGNMTLLNKSLNQSVSNNLFSEKVIKYKEKTTSDDEGTTFPMTYSIFNRYESEDVEWSISEVQRRADSWSALSKKIWTLD